MAFIEIKIPKEVRDYHENIFFGLNTRLFICSVLAVGVAVGIYFALQPYVGTEEIGWMCILGAAPFAVCGFFTYHGMSAEQVLWALIQQRYELNLQFCNIRDTLVVLARKEFQVLILLLH